MIFDYRALPDFLRAMCAWRKREDRRFSVRRETHSLRRCSPALVTRVLQGKRRLTLDRVDAFAQLLTLTAEEKGYLRQWVARQERPHRRAAPPLPAPPADKSRRKRAHNHLFNDWLNLYVKHACALKGFVPEATTIHRLLGGIASVSHIERSLRFLFREGYLRRTLDGRVVENDAVTSSTDEIPSARIRAFHRQALALARDAVAKYPVERRQAGTVTLTLDEPAFRELKAMLKDFYERVLQFAEDRSDGSEQLYQVTLHLCPIGGQSTCDAPSES